ncbi:MAG: hypothetical protein PHR94_13130 [Methylomonas lenta]|nr:hypothetical protein [Methylomonas lenta]
MQRCPCCHARLKSEPICPRCGAELSRVLCCEQLAQVWLSLALQTLSAGQAEIAVAAVKRSLSYQQTQAARLFRDFLIHQQYQVLYGKIEQKQWSDARQTVACLQSLQGDNESLQRFLGLIEHLALNRDEQ